MQHFYKYYHFTTVMSDDQLKKLDEIKRDMQAVGGASVFANDKLSSTWGSIKSMTD
jgi:hypothetical protein